MRVPFALKLVGYGLLVVVLVATMLITDLTLPARAPWLVAFAAFAIAFHLGASAPPRARTQKLVALAIQIPAMLAMAAVLPCYFGALALVIVASQAALVMSVAQVAAWIVAQTAVLGWLMAREMPVDDCVATSIALLGFQGFAATAVHVARREAEARQALARANAELRGTRLLLAETSRAHERARIARELHDVLGHDLTALGLQLEISTHVGDAQAAVHVARAREISVRLLRNVREVVRETRACDAIDLGGALRALTDDLPGLTAHLELPGALVVDDPDHAHCIVRCVQEIVTNTLRHARAANLWITVARTAHGLEVAARDDGRGAARIAAGHGLSGMRARFEQLGGVFQITPAPSFAITARLPVGGTP